MSKHTPGPWETGCRRTQVEVRPEGWNVPMCVADCHPLNYPPDSEQERVANARLIAAAPDLLEGCKRLLSVVEAESEACGIYKAHIEIARAAVAKAEGREA